MTTDRKVVSNRKNAQRSTGPRSEKGKRRSRVNALRHGLAIAIGSDPLFDTRIKKLAAALVGRKRGQAVGEFTRQFAETHFDLSRLRKMRAAKFEAIVTDPNYLRDAHSDIDEELLKLERYEQRIYGRSKRALSGILAIIPPALQR
jgi:hypothetical protein